MKRRSKESMLKVFRCVTGWCKPLFFMLGWEYRKNTQKCSKREKDWHGKLPGVENFQMQMWEIYRFPFSMFFASFFPVCSSFFLSSCHAKILIFVLSKLSFSPYLYTSSLHLKSINLPWLNHISLLPVLLFFCLWWNCLSINH